MSTPAAIALIIVGSVVGIVAAIYLIVPLIKGIVWLVTGVFKAVGAVIMHFFRFISGMIGDVVRSIGAVLTGLLFTPLVLGNVVIGRWSASAHYGRALKDEFSTLGHCIYRVVIGHPARFFLLHGLIEGMERRIPQAMADAPGADRPSARTGQFEGYTIVGSLPGGGSGGRLYVAEPDARKRAGFAKAGHLIEQVVIKSFSLGEGSTLPQIIRESRALEAAKKLGLILDHELNDARFFYAMAYVPGDSLSVVTKRLHTEAGADGLGHKQLVQALGMVADLLAELDRYHKGGLWHKDVKPDNIIVNDGRAHLVDLGLITPLRSAMTLTTHGTEYFRDPEMVRMALRGAKVNEVDGVKFDVYGVGAVLYSVIENNFPAHGGLSQFMRRCPEALRWIVRRAMTDMSNRYASANEMLADVRTIMAASDPFVLQPIDLPSVKGEPAVVAAMAASEPPPSHGVWPVRPPAPIPPSAPAEPRFEPAVARAASPVPPAEPGHRHFEVGPAAIDIQFGVTRDRGPTVHRGSRVRPVLQVTDWYRGGYVRAGDAGAGAEPAAPRVHPVGPARGRGPRGTAAEQLERARNRVHSAQSRVHGRLSGLHTSRFSNKPNSGVAAAFFIFLAVCVAFPMALVVKSVKSSGQKPLITQEDGSDRIRISLGGGEAFTFSVPKPEFDFDKDGEGLEKINQLGEKVAAAFDKMRDAKGKSPNDEASDEAAVQGVSNKSDAPAQAATPMPVVDPIGTVLFLNMLPFDVSQREAHTLNAIVGALNKGRFSVRGLGHEESETDLLAAGKNVVGLSDPRNDDAVDRVQQWLESQDGVDAVLWIGLGESPDEVARQLVIKRGYPRQPLLRALGNG